MMRLRQLDLELFGGFNGKCFDFGPRRKAATPDLHVIYGPNEAGKTTTMEGYLRLLYGFPHREPYDFLHQRKNLRVSGLLEIDGNETAFTRLPTRDPSLRDAHGRELPNGALQAHLSGLSEEDYRNLLCLDDLTIEKGGEEIARAKGDIGKLLFSAAAGISELSDVLDHVQQEANSLYRKRASTTRMAMLKKEHAETERQIRELDVSATQYRGLKKTTDEARAEEISIFEHRKTFFSVKADLDARIKALPVLSEIDGLDEGLAEFRAWPEQLDIDPEGLVHMLTDQAKAQNDTKKLSEELDALRKELTEIEHHPEHLVLSRELEDLDALRSRYATANLDLDRRRSALEQVLDDIRLAARDLGAPAHTDPQNLILSPAALSGLDLARELTRDAESAVMREREEVTVLDEEIEVAVEKQNALSTDVTSSPDLEKILERFDIDALSARRSAACETVKTARRHARETLDTLTIKGQNFDDQPTCPLLLEEAEVVFAGLQEIEHRHETAVREREKIQTEIAERNSQIAQIKAIDGLIVDDEVRSLKAHRDKLWKAHRTGMTVESAKDFENALIRVDGAMDMRLSQASDLGTLRQQERDFAALEARVKLADQQIVAIVEKRDASLHHLQGAANEAGIKASIAPEAFVSWLRKLEAATQAQAALQRLQDEHRETFEKADRLTQTLSKHFCRDTPDFDELVTVARTHLATQRAYREKLRLVKSRIDDLSRDRTKRADKLADREEQAVSARRDWLKQVSETLPAGIKAELLETSLQTLHHLRERDKERVALERQVSSMVADQIQFTEKVNELFERVGAIPMDTPLADYDALKAMSEKATDAEDKSRTLAGRIVDLETALAATTNILDDINLAVAEMARLFPDQVDTGSLEALRQAVSIASGVITDRARCAELVRDLLTTLDLVTLEDARAVLTDTTQAELRADLDEVTANLEHVENRYKAAIEARTTAEQELLTVGGDADVTLLVERKTIQELEMQEAALRHLELSLGHRLAEAAINRYRDEHRSSMMQVTEAAFVELTNGAYTHLQSQTDGTSETLLALDAGGMAKQAQDMSKGTRFQLYLALRAAAYEQLSAQGTSLPFFCDDIFETFDEERTRSACRVMERIARRGQAIYLTHHQHVVDIALEICGDGVQIHNIEI